MRIRFAVVHSHPIQYFTPLFREIARLDGVEFKAFFCCDWGMEGYVDPGFQMSVKWDIPLLEGFDYEFLPIARRPERLGFWETDNPSVGEALARFDPDVVMVFGYARRTNWRVVKWARSRQKPVLYASDSNAKRSISPWKQAAKSVVVRYFYSHLAGALCMHENNRVYHLKYGLPADRLFPGTIPIDRRRMLAAVPDREEARRRIRERHAIPADAFVAILCAKLIALKRPLDLVNACSAARSRGVPAWALLVGEGPERAAVEEHCRREAVEHVTLAGFVNQSSLPAYYAAADVLCLPSSRDALGLVVCEGAAFGLPAIVSDVVGCVGPDEVAQPGVNAFTFPCGDVEGLARAIERLYGEPQLYLAMSRESERLSKLRDLESTARHFMRAAQEVVRLGART